MTEFEFDLMFSLPDDLAEDGDLIDSLFEAGCDDALIGLGTPGILALGFTRTGEDAEAVITEAVRQAMAALPNGTELREVKPDLVSLADVAARLNVSRQALQKRKMPAPSLGGLYRASEMLPFLVKQPGKIQDNLPLALGWFASAKAAQKINAHLSLKPKRKTA